MWEYNYLEHHGILGQKWGIRRYQNKDGTLTNAGKRRAAQLEDDYKKLTGNSLQKSSTEEKTVKTEKSADYKSMSDEELTKAISRGQLERKYKDIQEYGDADYERLIKKNTIDKNISNEPINELQRKIDYINKTKEYNNLVHPKTTVQKTVDKFKDTLVTNLSETAGEKAAEWITKKVTEEFTKLSKKSKAET